MKQVEAIQLRKVNDFLCEFAASLSGSGATAAQIDQSIEKMGHVYAGEADVTILPSSILITLWDKEHENSYAGSIKMKSKGLNFNMIIKLCQLSCKVDNCALPLAEAVAEYKEIVAQKKMNSVAVLLLSGLANASFCRLFGGDIYAVIIVLVATLCGFYWKNKLHAGLHIDIRLATILASCISAIISCSGYVFNISSTPEIAVGTSVLYLIPGVPYINSLHDAIHNHHVCAFSRFMQALVLTMCLGIGLALAVMIMNIAYF